MTGTQGEPSPELHDDLADENAKKKDSGDSEAADSRPKDAPSEETRPKKTRSTKKKAPPPSKGKPIARILALLVLVGIPVALLLFSGRERGGNRPPKAASLSWNAGQEVEVDITLVSADRNDLACSSTEEVGGKHCAFESATKASPKGSNDDKTLLRPYMTVKHEPLLAAGVWSEPILKGALPNDRFSIRCKYKVEGKVKKHSSRWKSTGEWFEERDEWPAGSVSGCTMIK